MQLTDFLGRVARVTPVRIAVLADIHGNLPALRAVLDELDREPVDAIVVAGDVVGGPLVRETLELLAARREPTRWVRGNCEREAVAIYDGAPVSDDPAGRVRGVERAGARLPLARRARGVADQPRARRCPLLPRLSSPR